MQAALALALALLAGPSIAATTYYVDPVGGSDSNSGLTPALAWQTTTNVNTTQLQPGDSVLFKGGTTCAGCSVVLGPNDRGNPNLLIAISAWGGIATLTPTATAPCVAVTGAAGYKISNLICTGVGSGTSTNGGISFSNPDTRAASFQLDTVNISNVTVTGFHNDALGFFPGTATAKPGFKNITISNFTASANGGSGINISADGGTQNFGNGNSTPSFSNVLVDHCTLSNDNFNEIYFAEIATDTVQYCKVNVNLTGNGIYSYDGSASTFQYNEIFNSTGFGIDFDIGSVGSLAQGNWIHSANGIGGNAGIEVVGAVSGAAAATHNITLRFNVLENTSQIASTDTGAINVTANVAGMSGIAVYNNTIYETNNPASQGLVVLWGSGVASMTGFVANNVMYAGASVANIIHTRATNPALMTFTGNDYFMAGTFGINWNNVAYPSFAAWQTATGQEKIAGSNVGLTSDPLLTNPGNGVATGGYNPAMLTAYQLKAGSPMIGAGVNLATQYGVSVANVLDYYGNQALGPAGYDIGAHSK